jgi:hypothetical protein
LALAAWAAYRPLPGTAYTFEGWTRRDLIDTLVVSGDADYFRLYSPKLGKHVSKLPGIGAVEGINYGEAMRDSKKTVPGSRPSTWPQSMGRTAALEELDAKAVKVLGVEKGAYTRVFEEAIAVFDNQAVFVPVSGDVLGGAEINQ